MEKVFKIEQSLVGKAAFRPMKRLVIPLAIMVIVMGFLQLQTASNKPGSTASLLVLTLGPLLIGSFAIFFTLRIKKRVLANLEINVNEKGIYKYINYETELQLNGIEKAFIDKTNRQTALYNSSLNWQEITSIEDKTGDLKLKSARSNKFYGTGQILVPKELEQYEEFRNLVAAQTGM